MRLAEHLVDAPPGRPGSLLSPLLGQQRSEIEFAAASNEIHILAAHDGGLVHELIDDVAGDDDWDGKVDGEEDLSVGLSTDGPDGSPELGDEDKAVEDEAEVGADDTRLRGEGELVESVALELPRATEPDMAEADGAPGEDGGETGESHHPGEGFALLGRGGEVAKETEEGGDGDADDRAAAAVNVGEDLGGLALLGEGGEGAGRAVDGGVADGEDSNHDDYVHDVGEDADTGVLNGNDEGRGLGIRRRASVEKSALVVRDKETDESKRDNVEEGDTPEDLLDSSGERLARVGSFGSSKTNKLSTGERKGSSDEH